MVWIKVCGITRPEDARAAEAAGADAIGFILWPGSPRCVEPEAAAQIGAALPARLERVGVFVDAAPEAVAAAVKTARLTMVQLHGDESPAAAESLSVPVLKAFRQVPGRDQVAAWAGAFAILADGASPGAYGGTGQPAAADLIAAARAHPRLVLAGGLAPENVGERIAAVRPWGVDASSSLETAPGVKDPARVHEFVQAARGATPVLVNS